MAKNQRVWIEVARFGGESYDLMGYMEGPCPEGGYLVRVPSHGRLYRVHNFMTKSEKDLQVVRKIMKS